MALPFIAGLALGALGVVAYKNRDTLIKKGENILKDATSLPIRKNETKMLVSNNKKDDSFIESYELALYADSFDNDIKDFKQNFTSKTINKIKSFLKQFIP